MLDYRQTSLVGSFNKNKAQILRNFFVPFLYLNCFEDQKTNSVAHLRQKYRVGRIWWTPKYCQKAYLPKELKQSMKMSIFDWKSNYTLYTTRKKRLQIYNTSESSVQCYAVLPVCSVQVYTSHFTANTSK